MLRLTLIGCSLTAASACGYQRPCAESDGSVIQVQLVDGDDQPVPYGTVRAVHTSGTLNECLPYLGSSYACGPLAAGVWTLHASAPGFTSEQFALEATVAPSCGDPEVIVQLQLSGAPLQVPSDAMEADLTEFGRCPTSVWAGDSGSRTIVEVFFEGEGDRRYDLATEAALSIRTGLVVAPSCAVHIETTGVQDWLPSSGTLEVDSVWLGEVGDGRQAYRWHARAEQVVLEEASANLSTQLVAFDVYGITAY